MRSFEHRSGESAKVWQVSGVTSAAELTETRDHRERVLADRHSEPELVAAARAFLDGSRTTPLGAAATAWACWDVFAHPHIKAAVADGWIAAHGPAFAAQAVLELSGLQNGKGGHLGRNERISYWLGAPWRPAAERVRARLAVADDAAYAQARQAIEAYRSTKQHMLAAFLLPTEPYLPLVERLRGDPRQDPPRPYVIVEDPHS